MKKFFCIFISLAVLNLSVRAISILPRGTVVFIRTLTEVTSQNDGEVDAVVDADVKTSDGVVAIRKGTRVDVSMERQRARCIGKPGSIVIKSMATTSVDGQTIRLTGNVKEEGEDRRMRVLGLGLGLGLGLLYPCLLILAKKGGKAVIPAETIYNQFTTADEYQVSE